MKPTTRSKRQSPQPIRLVPYYVNANISGAETLNMLQADDGPVAYILNYFQRTLSVVPFQDNLRTPANAMCGPHVKVPNDHADPGVPNVDYVYYITAVNDGMYIRNCMLIFILHIHMHTLIVFEKVILYITRTEIHLLPLHMKLHSCNIQKLLVLWL